MIIYKDKFNGHEVFTDSNKIDVLCDGEVLRVKCNEIQETVGNDFDIGANASQEEQGEDLENVVKCGIDIVMRQHLEEVTHELGSKALFKAYFKKYLKRLSTKMADKSDDQKKSFQGAANDIAKEILGSFDDVQFFRPERDYEKEEDETNEPFVIPMIRSGDELTMIFFKSGLDEEKA